MKLDDETKAKIKLGLLLAGVAASFLLMLFGGHLIEYLNNLLIENG